MHAFYQTQRPPFRAGKRIPSPGEIRGRRSGMSLERHETPRMLKRVSLRKKVRDITESPKKIETQKKTNAWF